MLKRMKYILITQDAEVESAARLGLHPSDEFLVFSEWEEALEKATETDLIFVDMEATLLEPNKVQGYEVFAKAKMEHPVAAAVPTVLISPPPEYDLDFMAGWPDFLYGHVRKPVTYKIFRRASTWV